MKDRREPMRSEDEYDALSHWKSLLCVFYNNTGLAKRAKRAISRRHRKRWKADISAEADSWA